MSLCISLVVCQPFFGDRDVRKWGSAIAQSYLLNGLLLTSLFSVTPICLPPVARAQILENSRPSSPQKVLIKDELYFGLKKPDGDRVSVAEWQQFLNTVITPRFQEGLTVLDAYGQYLDGAGILTQENSKLVIFIYEDSTVKKQAIAEIIDLYKRTFHQESVLRVTSEVKASF